MKAWDLCYLRKSLAGNLTVHSSGHCCGNSNVTCRWKVSGIGCEIEIEFIFARLRA